MIIKVCDYTGRQFRVGDPMPGHTNLTVIDIERGMYDGLIVHLSDDGVLHLPSYDVDWYSVVRGNE